MRRRVSNSRTSKHLSYVLCVRINQERLSIWGKISTSIVYWILKMVCLFYLLEFVDQIPQSFLLRSFFIFALLATLIPLSAIFWTLQRNSRNWFGFTLFGTWIYWIFFHRTFSWNFLLFHNQTIRNRSLRSLTQLGGRQIKGEK